MAILTNSGRIAMAASVKSQPIHLAWGRGSPDWDAAPQAEGVEATALVNEIGRRKATYVSYCEPDEQGEIVLPTGTFREVVDATKHLYMRFSFDYTDAPSADIRELGVFVGTQVAAGLPAGQMYFDPAQVTASGLLLLLEHVDAFPRSASVRQVFEFVVTF